MSFNLDDPLAGILSDGSDDSFFDDDILGKKKPAKKKSTPIAEKKNALFDLGDGDADNKVRLKSLDDKKDSLFDLGKTDFLKRPSEDVKTKQTKTEVAKSPGAFRRTISKESINVTETKSKPFDLLDAPKSPVKPKLSTSVDKLDIFGDSNESRKDIYKPLEKGKSSQSLLDDILGGPTSKTAGSTQLTRPVTAAKSQEYDFDTILEKKESKLILTSNKASVASKSVPAKVDNTKETANPRTFESSKETTASKTKKATEDWLGIFGDKEEDNQDIDDGMPAWLVGDSKKKKASDSETKSSKTTKGTLKDNENEDLNQNAEHNLKEPELSNIHIDQLATPAPTLAIPNVKNSNEDISMEGANLFMQQQEAQLMVALQLKAQEEKLAALQMRQKETQRVQREAAHAQHSQLDAMLRRQAEQRQQMQNIIAAHQERITQRIKALLSTTTDTNVNGENFDEEAYETNRYEKTESPHFKEKKQLLQLVQSLQENHDKEIDLMETSYRRQLAFLEISLNQSEERMKEESEKLVKFYSEKISWLEEHHHLYKKLAEDNLTALAERHRIENEMLRKQHLENVGVLQEHHATLLENIKNAVNHEQVLIKNSAGFSSSLHELVTDVKESKSQCQQLVEKVQALTENNQREVERSLQTRETNINDMIQQLKKERENFESEKLESREMIKMLETRLKQMNTMIEEETGALKQKKMEFEFEKATFSKQTEFAKNVLKKQDEEIKMLKEGIQKEYKEKITKIDEEKAKALKDSAAIAKEKVSIQNLKQELEKTKAELQAQLEEITEERSKLNLEKQQMHMEEQRVLAKTRDLDILAKTAIEKQSQADKKYSEAEFIQRKYEDRIRRMQEHVVSLNTREKQIAREKVALSRERLALHNERKQIEGRYQCSLCKTSQNAPTYSIEPNYNMIPDNFLTGPVSRDYGGLNVSSAMSNIEQEMAHLLGRNFSLRHTTGYRNVGNYEEKYAEHIEAESNFRATQSTQVESGAFKDYNMDPKFMMLRLDVQQVLNNLEQSKKEENVLEKDDENKEEDN